MNPSLKTSKPSILKVGRGRKPERAALTGCEEYSKIAEVRGIEAGTAVISPPTFVDLLKRSRILKNSPIVFRRSDRRDPWLASLSANHIEEDIQFALDASADSIILDGRGGGTGAAPEMFRVTILVCRPFQRLLVPEPI